MKTTGNIEFVDSDDDDGAFEELGNDEVDALDDDNKLSTKNDKAATPPESPTAKKKKKAPGSPGKPKKRKSSKKLASTKSLKDTDTENDGKPKSVKRKSSKKLSTAAADGKHKKPSTKTLKVNNDKSTKALKEKVDPDIKPKSLNPKSSGLKSESGDTASTDAAKAKMAGAVGVNVTFDNLEYTVQVDKKETLTILKGLTGTFLPGELTALMGPSGSGKTTLLDVLAGRKNSGSSSGNVFYGNRKPTTDEYRLTCGYVEQFDTLVGELTVENMLHYTAELKLPSEITKEERHARVEEVIQMLDLESCRNTVIGNPLSRGISGGQAKRVNIGLALITRPPILFLDEPTSGLDSRTANEVVELLRSLAHDGGRTIVCTIHSPSGHAFSLFDELYMIHKGETVYNGPVSKVQKYFEGQGHTRDPDASLPEWLVDLTSDLEGVLQRRPPNDNHMESGKLKRSSSSFAETYHSSQFKKVNDLERSQRLKLHEEVQQGETRAVLHPPSQLRKVITLLKYRTTAHYQDGEYLGTRLGDKVVFALLIMSLYWRIGDELDPQSIASTASLLFFVATLCGFGAAAFVPALNLERKLFYRELADGCYAPATYYFAKFLEEAFIALFTSGVFSVIVYFSLALTGNFGVFFVAYYLTTLIGVILAYAVSAVVPSLEAANALLPTYVTICLYFGGLFIVFEKIPKGWKWFSWTSFLRYSWGAMMVDNYRDSETGKIPVFFDSDGNPQTVLEFYGMDEGPVMNSVGACLGLLTTLLAFFTIIGVWAVVYIRHEKR